jgi:predicted O-methyltransferase YrrM
VRFRIRSSVSRAGRRLARASWIAAIQVPLSAAAMAFKDPPSKGLHFAASARLKDEVLAEMLAERELGGWSLSAAAINYLTDSVRALNPHAALEFGSGASTLAIARALVRGTLMSLEQSQEYRAITAAELATHRLDEVAKVCHVPLVDWLAEDPPSLTEFVRGLAKSQPFDFVFIDGPAGPPGIRGPILSAILPSLSPNATILLDDALRPPELEFIERWKRLGFKVNALRLVGKGMVSLTRIEGPRG